MRIAAANEITIGTVIAIGTSNGDYMFLKAKLRRPSFLLAASLVVADIVIGGVALYVGVRIVRYAWLGY